MRWKQFRSVATLAVGLTLSVIASPSRGQILGVLNSDVEGYFGTQSDALGSSTARDLPYRPGA